MLELCYVSELYRETVLPVVEKVSEHLHLVSSTGVFSQLASSQIQSDLQKNNLCLRCKSLFQNQNQPFTSFCSQTLVDLMSHLKSFGKLLRCYQSSVQCRALLQAVLMEVRGQQILLRSRLRREEPSTLVLLTSRGERESTEHISFCFLTNGSWRKDFIHWGIKRWRTLAWKTEFNAIWSHPPFWVGLHY